MSSRPSLYVPGITSPKWSLAVVVVLTTAINIAYCALLVGDDPYGQIEPVREAAVSIVATCTAFSGVFGVIGAIKADRTSLILTLSFFLSTAATIRFDVEQASPGCEPPAPPLP